MIAVLLWVWIAVVVLALIILAVTAGRLLGRLGTLGRAVARARHRSEDVAKLQVKLAALEQTVLAVQEKTEAMADRK